MKYLHGCSRRCFNHCFAHNNVTTTATGDIRVYSIRSTTACAILSIDNSQKLASLAFRGTRDPTDVITDLMISSSDFEPRKNVERGLPLGRIEVHRGFLSAFESVSLEINEILDTLNQDMRLMITGHSMGKLIYSSLYKKCRSFPSF